MIPRVLALAAVFTAAGLVYFWKVFFAGMHLVQPDINPYYHPVWNFAVEEMRAGRFPLWNPFASFGTPFFANPQTCVTYPPIVILYLGDLYRQIEIYILAHLVFAALGAYRLGRVMGLSRAASVTAGLAFAFSGYCLSTVRLTIALASVAYVPWVLSHVLRSLDRASWFRSVGLACLLLLQYLAGDPALTAATALMLGLLWAGWMCRRKEGRLAGTLMLGGGYLMFLCVGAYQILPFAEFIQQSSRSAIPLAKAAERSLPWWRLSEIILPGRSFDVLMHEGYSPRDHWLSSAYAGLLVCLLALAGIRKAMPMRDKALWAMALAGLLLSLGQHTPVYEAAFRFIPGFSLLRYPQRFLFITHLALACLCGAGLDRILSRMRSARMGLLISILLPILVTADLFTGQVHPNQSEASVLTTDHPNIALAKEDPSLYRVMASPQTMKQAFVTGAAPTMEEMIFRSPDEMLPNYPLLHRMHYLMGYDSLYPKAAASANRQLLEGSLDSSRLLLDRSNVKYIVSPSVEMPGFDAVGTGWGGVLHRNRTVWPRAFWVPLDEAAGEGDVLTLNKNAAPRPARITAYQASAVALEADMDVPGYLVLSDLSYPGWVASVDGRAAEPRTMDGLYRALRLDAGSHRVQWDYRPEPFRRGLWISAAALMMILLMSVRAYIKLK